MEAVPKLPLLSFELKASSEITHFAPKLKQYIAEAYREDPDSYSNELHQLEGLRSAAVRPTIDAAGLSALTRYFCQLRAMQSRFPMAKGQPAACTFAWRDLYANMSISQADIRFEMASILYNIGALHTQLGASEPRTSADSMKAACLHYQNAAWAFQHLREQYTQPSGVDISAEIMRVLQEICFAQAQECILDKSIQDTKKPSVIGAVATQVLNFYKNSNQLLGPNAGSDTVHETVGMRLHSYWCRYVSFKTAYIGCLVALYQGMHAEEQQKMGERVAFYQLAVDRLNEARKLAKHIEPVQITQEALTFTNDVVEGKRKAAKNENEFIYHEEVPEKELLTELKPVCLVKAVAINFNDADVVGQDLFSRLVPMGAHEASSLYSEEKAKLLRHISGLAEDKNMELTEFMSSLQLDQLDVIDSDQNIPQEIVDRCAAMNAKSDIIQNLVDSMNNLAEIISDVEHSLAEIKTFIQEETLKEKEFQKAMGPRPPSIVQTELSREYHKYQEAHTRTNESNQVLHKAMTLHIANLRLLSQPLEVLQSKIPCIENIEGLDRETMLEMRRVVGKAREMQSQRDTLIQQLRDAITSDDITAKLLARSSSDPIEEIFQQELDKYKPQVKIIKQNLAAQENIINKLTSLYASYGDSRRLLSEVLRKRDGLINALITSYDTYQELLGKSQKGQEFYKKLSHNVNQLLTRLKSTCQVQEEERQQLMTKQNSKAPTPTPVSLPKSSDSPPPVVAGSNLKLKDYLPYMKNRGLPRNMPSQVPEAISSDTYYPETIYPNTIRPPPLGSEATDMIPPGIPDGVVMPNAQNMANYNRYNTPYVPSDTNPYVVPSYNYPTTSSAQDYDVKPPEELPSYSYSSSYTPSHYSTQNMPGQQTYTNTYYSATPSNTQVTDSQGPMTYNPNMVQGMNPNQYNPYDQIYRNQLGATQAAATAASALGAANQAELNAHFTQMQVSAPQPEQPTNIPSEYYYNSQFPPNQNVNIPPYSAPPANSFSNLPPTQSQPEYSQRNNPYRHDTTQYNVQVPVVPTTYSTAQVVPDSNNMTSNINAQYSGTSTNEANSQGYAFYTNTHNNVTTTSSISEAPVSMVHAYDNTAPVDPTLAYLDAFDKPIKSHAKGEALSSSILPPTYTTYSQSQPIAYQNPNEQTYQSGPSNYQFTDTNVSGAYTQNYQNHPGYAFNPSTGAYDYNYGSQNSHTAYSNQVSQDEVNSQTMAKDPNWPAQGMYTSAGACETLQSPSEAPAMNQVVPEQAANNQDYFNVPYGYQTTTNQSLEMPPDSTNNTNYGANVNQSTYMQSGKLPHTNVTFTNNKVSSPKEDINEPSYDQSVNCNVSNDYAPKAVESSIPTVQSQPQASVEEQNPEPSAFDLLSDIDFSVKHTPLTPEIKVPPISESMIKKNIVVSKNEPVVQPELKEEIIQRPPRKDIFSDPSLLNLFTQQVKKLQTLVDSLSNKTSSGLILLDSKWKSFEEIQAKENSRRSKLVAIRHTPGNIVTGVVPYDDSRVVLKSSRDAYINASYYKMEQAKDESTVNQKPVSDNLPKLEQLSPWCIPVILSSNPEDNNYSLFWRAALDYKIGCVVCLLSEIELQGKSYWPTAIGQVMNLDNGLSLTLEEVTSTLHWTERVLKISDGSSTYSVTHYQITVFPAKVVCSPLLLLTHKILSATTTERGVWFHCAGGGRSAILSALCAVVSDVTAGNAAVCDLLEEILTSLYKHRTNVLEDTKYLADAYRTVLFYAQGALCSGTTKFNGDAVTMPSTLPVSQSSVSSQKPGKFSKETFEEMKHSPGLKSGDMKDPLNFLDPLWSLKKK